MLKEVDEVKVPIKGKIIPDEKLGNKVVWNRKYPDDFINKIIEGDCLEVMKEIPDKSISLVVTDPPYEIHARSGGGLHNKRDWLKKVADKNLDTFKPELFLEEIKRVCKNFHAYIFCSKNLLSKYIDYFKKNNLNWEILIYAKRNPIPTKNNKYLSDKEYCFFVRDKNCYFNNDLPFEEYKTVQYVNVKKNEFHPTQKNLEFISILIRKSSKEGDVILDPYIGSGTTAIVAQQLNRQYIGIEIDSAYTEISRKRLAQSNLLGI